jgi:hypothetical protein
MNDDNALSNLRDIHLPDAVSIWPLAPGWYIVLVLLLVITAYFYYRYAKSKKHRYYFSALQELEMIRHQKMTLPITEILIQLSALLRRTALARYPRQEVAGLQGEAWLQFLDQTSQTTAFTEGPGHVLITGPYQRHVTAKIETIFGLVENWIKQVCK